MEGATPVLPGSPALPDISSPWAGAWAKLAAALLGALKAGVPLLGAAGAAAALLGAALFVAGLWAGRKGVAKAGLALGLSGGGLWAAVRVALALSLFGR